MRNEAELVLLLCVFIAFNISRYSVSDIRFFIVYDVLLLSNLVEFTRASLVLLYQLRLYLTFSIVLEDCQETVIVLDVMLVSSNPVGAVGVPAIVHKTIAQLLSNTTKQSQWR